MFGGTKPTFGAAPATPAFGGFNTANSTFGQSAFSKPAATPFGAPATFGTQQTTPSLFGAAANQAPSTGLFGAAAGTSTAFGATTTTQPTFGTFSQQPQQNTSIFGATQPAATNSLFGQPSTSAFGSAVKPPAIGFGQTAQSSSLFGQPPTASTASTGFGGFGQAAAPTTTNVFGSGNTSAFGQPSLGSTVNAGTSIAKYQPTIGQDTLMKSGVTSNVNTKQHCITAMKEYEAKSLEELRMEDYLANRKGPQAGTSGAGGFFGSPAQPGGGTGLFGSNAQQTTGLFGQPAPGTENKGLFGGTTFGQQSTGFGATQNNFLNKSFGAPTTTGFGAPAQDASNPFGQKPAFGQTAAPTLFGQQPAVSSAPTFGQQPTTGFGGFGAPGTQQPSLFGQTANDPNKPAFGLGTSTANTGFGGFGSTATSTAGGGLFAAKPATGFGATAGGFGAPATSTAGFGNFSMGTNTGGGLFNANANKPATSGFGGFGTQTSAPSLNFNAGTTGGTLFGNTAQKPGGLFGGGTLGSAPGNTGGGLFGGAGGFGAPGSTLGGGFGTSTLSGNMNPLGGFNASSQQQPASIHQQILAKITSPYGDNPIFKDLKRSDETDALKPTDPAAQKSILESTTNAQFKVSAKDSSNGIKVKPVGNALTKKSLFEGLEEFDSSVEGFSLKPNAKRLILKPKSSPNNSNSNQNNVSTPNQSQVVNQSASGARNTSLSDARNESFTGEIPYDASPSTSFSAAQKASTSSPKFTSSNGLPKDPDASRRESWLHPNNLEKLRERVSEPGPANNTLTDLIPRKPLETFRGSGGPGPITMTGRPSVSTVIENPFEDEEDASSMSLRQEVDLTQSGNGNAYFGYSSSGAEDRHHSSSANEEFEGDYEEHPTGITLRRAGYYTIPSLDDLKSYLAEDGTCVVPNFTIGREGYGNVFFNKEMNVSGLNLDEIVHFRHKEIIIYPDDSDKPPIGSGLNREAQVTLDKVWPHDKTKHEPIKDPQRLIEMDWEGRLRRACDKNDTRFVEYRPETGSWVFRVKHFSKYGLSDSDEEDETVPTDPKKAKMGVPGAHGMIPKQFAGVPNQATQMTLASLKNAQKVSEEAARSLDPRTFASVNQTFEDPHEYMHMNKSQYFENQNMSDFSFFDRNKNQIGYTSPTAALAKESGADSHKLQLMKASLFFDADADLDHDRRATGKAERETIDFDRNLGKRSTTHGPWKGQAFLDASEDFSLASSQMDFDIHAASPFLPASSSVSLCSGQDGQTGTSSPVPDSEETLIADPETVSSKLPLLVARPKVAPTKSLAMQVPYGKSFVFNLKGKWANDLGIYNARFLKTSWGNSNTLIVPTTREIMSMRSPTDIFKSRSVKDFSATVLQHVQITSIQNYENFEESIVDHLRIQLQHSLKDEIEGSDCPYIKSSSGADLILHHLEQAERQIGLGIFEEYACSVWSLCYALWGEHEILEGREPTSHFAVMCRRGFLSDWLETTLTDKDILTKTVSKHTYLDHLLELVMCHKVTEACELAFQYDDANLALMLSQLSSGAMIRKLMEDQLAEWYKEKADEFITVERLKLFMLVAGVALMESSHGPLNVVDGLDWIKALALHLWYLCSPTSSVTDAVLAYERSFKAEDFFSMPPTPIYLDDNDTHKANQNPNNYDMRYHLLQLFSKRSHPLESLLNPATYTADPMDYRLSWLMLQTLEALGYHHCSELCDSQLHVGFASQLENNNLWQWSIFVLLHIKDRNQRELAVQNILYRHVSVSKDVALTDEEKFVINNLGVPEKWIDYAKAVKAGSYKLYDLQAKYLLKAKQWPLAHDIIFQHIAPDAIINDNLDYLHELLSSFEDTDLHLHVKVPNWSNQGQIFLDFIDIKEKFSTLRLLKTEADIETRWENLKPQIADLCSRINLLPCPTAKHRLCQSEIAQNLACLIRGVLLVCPGLDQFSVIRIALERLPLPQEFAQQELRALLDCLVEDLSRTYLNQQQQQQRKTLADQQQETNLENATKVK